jgi:hypothetical protein
MFDKFIELIQDQFSYGGKKYGLNEQRESTDVLFEIHGKNWLFGTIDKYTFRFKNLAREKDLLKIATYMYILWLKRGFYVMPNGIVYPPIDTNIKTKEAQFPLFIEKLKKAILDYGWGERYHRVDDESKTFINNDSVVLQSISTSLQSFSKVEWKEIKDIDLFRICYLSFVLWERNFSKVAGQDTDTYNEKK